MLQNGKSFFHLTLTIPFIISIMLSQPPLVFFPKTGFNHSPAHVSSSFLFKIFLILLCIIPKNHPHSSTSPCVFLIPFQKRFSSFFVSSPRNHPHSSIIYIHLSCLESTLPKPMWSLSMSVFCTFPLTPPP